MNTKFVIVGAPRTGSTMLVKTLHSVDGICCHGELLNARTVSGYADGFDPYAATPEQREQRKVQLEGLRDESPVAFIRDALAGGASGTEPDDARANGFKALYADIFNKRWQSVIDDIVGDSSIHFIHLVRQNDLRRYVSERILKAGGTNHSAVGGRSNRSVTVNIDIEAFRARNTEIQREIDSIRTLLQAHETLELSYEELATNAGTTIARTAAFLGITVSPAAVEPALQKVGSSDLSASVSNYAELLEHSLTRDFAIAD